MGKCYLATPEAKAEIAALAPEQCGVGVSGAAELAAMGLQGLVRTLPPDGDWVVLQVDMTNAFNTIDRLAMLRGAMKVAPGAFNWLRFCYDEPTGLICAGQRFCESRTGVHQGDAMGPLAFALGLKSVTDEAPALDLIWKSWYLDDGTIVGPAREVFK